MTEADIGLVGLAVMGRNLALNINDHNFTVAVFNRTSETTDVFINDPAAGGAIRGCHSLKALAEALTRPRKIILMVKAGGAVDHVIGELLPHLTPGDIIH